MRFSVLAVAATAATGVSAVPILGDLVASLTLTLGDTLASAVLSAGGVDNTLNLVLTIATEPGIRTLSVIDGSGDHLLAHSCTDKLVDDVFESIPIDFSQVGSDGLGSFLYNGVIYPVADTIKYAPAVACLTHLTEGLTTVRCIVPKLESVVLRAVEDVEDVVNCLVNKVTVVDVLDNDYESYLSRLPVFSGLAILAKIPGVIELVALLGL